MRGRDPIVSEARRAVRTRRLPEGAVCALCGEADVDALVLDVHHLVGRAHAPDVTAVVCRNHHALLHAGMRDAGADLRPQPTHLERGAAILRSQAALHLALARSCEDQADALDGTVEALDGSVQWRSVPGVSQ